MLIEIFVSILTFDLSIGESLNNSDDYNSELGTWDLTPEKLNSDLYLKNSYFDIKCENQNLFKLCWKLETLQVIENLEIVYKGIINQLDMLESSLNAAYHLIDDNLIEPEASLEITSVFLNGESVKSTIFDDFNSKNKEIEARLLKRIHND